MSDIFISYAREDRETAQRLARALTKRGWSVWWDRQILPGRSFDQVIGEQLEAARCVVVLWSRASVQSEWTKEEADAGKQRGALVPALIEDVRIPLGFSRIQAADLVGWNGDEQAGGFADLISAVGALLTPVAGNGCGNGVDKVGTREERVAATHEREQKPVRVYEQTHEATNMRAWTARQIGSPGLFGWGTWKKLQVQLDHEVHVVELDCGKFSDMLDVKVDGSNPGNKHQSSHGKLGVWTRVDFDIIDGGTTYTAIAYAEATKNPVQLPPFASIDHWRFTVDGRELYRDGRTWDAARARSQDVTLEK